MKYKTRRKNSQKKKKLSVGPHLIFLSILFHRKPVNTIVLRNDKCQLLKPCSSHLKETTVCFVKTNDFQQPLKYFELFALPNFAF